MYYRRYVIRLIWCSGWFHVFKKKLYKWKRSAGLKAKIATDATAPAHTSRKYYLLANTTYCADADSQHQLLLQATEPIIEFIKKQQILLIVEAVHPWKNIHPYSALQFQSRMNGNYTAQEVFIFHPLESGFLNHLSKLFLPRFKVHRPG